MIVVDKKLLVQLRKATYAGFSECQKALEATNNNYEDSLTWLRKNGIAKAARKFSDKETTEGRVVVAKNEQGAAIIELSCETDFTSNSAPFIKLSTQIVDVVLEKQINSINAINELKIDNSSLVKDEILTLSSITGEKIELKKACYFDCSSNESIAAYQHHNNQKGALVKLNSKLENEVIKGLAVHLVANTPRFLSVASVDETWLENEKSIIFDLLKKDPKAEKLFDKILENKINKVINENCFLTQPYLYDCKKTVASFLQDLNTDVLNMIFFEIKK